MRRFDCGLSLLFVILLGSPAGSQNTRPTPDGRYAVAFASVAPLNTDIFIAAGDGRDAMPFLAHPDLDYNASFSPDGRSIVFTSTRNGSADIYRVGIDGGASLQRLTDDPAFDDQGVLSPDGKTLAFVSSRSGQADIWILELATGALRNLTKHPAGDFRPSWSPDGQRIAFSSDRDSKKTKFNFATLQSTEIYLVRTDGSGLREVTRRDAIAGGPAWSTDGKRILYHEAELDILGPQRGASQIVSIELATNERQVLTDGGGEKWSPRWIAGDRVAYVSRGPGGGVEFVGGPKGARGDMRSPAWSADGRRMVFHRDVETRWPPVRPGPSRDPSFRLVRTGIFPSYSPTGDRLVVNDERAGILHNSILVMNPDGSQRSKLFGDPERSALAPAWSPRGDRIATGVGRFFPGVQGPSTADIAVMSVDGKDVRILTDGSANHGFPSWSPDGRQLVFRLAGKELSGLVIVDVATGVLKTLTAGVAHDNFPSWSPKGDRIAFTSDRDGDYEIYTIRTDGTDVRRLTTSPGNDAHSSWSPDGEWIVFTSVRGGFKDEMALTPFNPQPNGDLWVMRPDGSDVRMLTDDQFEDGTPSWLPTPRR
jgi:Tol biopolymer transport system component